MPKTKQLLTLAVATAIAGTTMLGVTSATPSTFMQYDAVAGTITICDPNDSTKCITMQDKNLGATKAGTECSATDTGACGNHFQWGNNHGFEIGCFSNGCSDTVTNSATGTLAIWSSNYNHVGYVGNLFIKGTSSPYDYWSDNTPSNHNGLRGGEDDTQENNYGFDETNNKATNVENRRGPCGEGYHVPSQGERGTLLKYWAANYTGAGNTLNLSYSGDLPKFLSNVTAAGQFQEDFKIPFAGGRISAKVFNMGSNALLWSSSPYVGYDYARGFNLGPNGALADNRSYRANAFSLRCFKDSYLSFPSSEGGENTGQVTLTLTAGENTCTLQDYNLGVHNVSSEDQNVSTSGQNIVCEFLKNPGATIQLSMGDLVDGTKEIGRQYFTGVVTSLGNSLGTIANLTGGSYNFSGSHIIYTKQANTIGTWTGSLAIEGIIPAGTPSGEYTGELNVIICEGC